MKNLNTSTGDIGMYRLRVLDKQFKLLLVSQDIRHINVLMNRNLSQT